MTGGPVSRPLRHTRFRFYETNQSDPTDLPATPRLARFSLAANYDPDLVPTLAEYPVHGVYGKFPTDGLSGGLPRYLATPLFRHNIKPHGFTAQWITHAAQINACFTLGLALRIMPA